MKEISSSIWSYPDDTRGIRQCTQEEVLQGNGHFVRSFGRLVEHVAALSFNNPEYVLFYRGQSRDFKNRAGMTTIQPTLFRASSSRRPLTLAGITSRYVKLSRAEDLVMERFTLEGAQNVRRFNILRWALLQHYEVCPTPLLDVTHSLRVACSFAHFDDDDKEAYLYVLAMPQISGSVTASSEAGIQIIRLLSICPPHALRPHYQEGYLVGDYPTITLREKLEYERTELDFSRRILCKFRLGPPDEFWSHHFPNIQRGALYPNSRDPLFNIMESIRTEIED